MFSKYTKSDALANSLTRRLYLTVFLLLFVFTNSVLGSKVGKEKGSPAGSYALSGLDNVSLFSGNLNFNLPFLSVGGRGETGTQMSLNIQRNWTSWKYIYQQTLSLGSDPNAPPPPPDIVCYTYWAWWSPMDQHMYQMFCTPPNNFNSTTKVYISDIVFNNPIPETSLNPVKPGYGPGVLKGKTRLYATQSCKYYDPTTNTYSYNHYQQVPWQSQAYLTFTEPDGTEHEFVDQNTQGSMYTSPLGAICGEPSPNPRGTVWVSTQDTAVTFIADVAPPELMGTGDNYALESFYGPSGYLLKQDGSRLRIDEGLVTWIRDRNGNRTDFTYDNSKRVKTITDSLGRQTSVNYDVNDTTISPDGTAYGLCDQIIYNGPNETPRTIRITKTDLVNALRAGYSLQTTSQLWAHLGQYGNGSSPLQITVVSGLWLPDGRSYKFSYNSFAELARVELPTGGAVEYDHDFSINEIQSNGEVWHHPEPGPFLRRVAQWREYTDKTAPDSLTHKTTFGNIYPDYYFGQQPVPQPVVVDQRDKNNNLLSRTRHYFVGHPKNMVQQGPTSLVMMPPWNNGLEIQSEFLDADGETVLRRIYNTWDPRVPAQGTAGALDINLLETKATWVDSNLVTKQVFAYDDFNNLTDTREYDFGVGAPSTHPVRHVHSEYLTTSNGVDYTTLNGPHIRNLPRAQQVYSSNPETGVETLAAQVEMKYDETPLLPWYGGVQSWGDPGSARGNPTTSKAWLNTTGGWLETRAQFDQVGNVSKSWDALNNMSEVKYSEVYHRAFPTEVISPVPDPSGANGSTDSLKTKTTYDPSTGLVTTTEDANGQITTLEYNDPLLRITRVIPAPGRNQVIYEYGDTPGNLHVKVKKQIDENVWDEGFTYFDGLGRSIKAKSRDAQGDVFSETVYDALGRVSKTSSPYRPGEEKHWVETTYDSLGRAKEVISPKIANEATAARMTSEYSASTTAGQIGMVQIGINQTGARARSITNTLGQLIRVDEPDDAGNLGPLDNPSQATYYKYDALGNLSKVTQGNQARYFLYDSLGRLLRVRQAEQGINPALAMDDPVTGISQWSTGFTYDSSGNIKTATDAKGVTINYEYDKLNRIIQRSYSIPQTTDPEKLTSSTPTVTFKYDGYLSPSPSDPSPTLVSFARGALTEISNGISKTQYTTFDNSGRVRASRQIVEETEYTFGYNYNLSGVLIDQTYPSGRVVTNAFDNTGDLSSVSSSTPNQASKVYASDYRYLASGSVDQIKLGNGRWETYKFNARNQRTQLALGTSPTDTNLWKVNYDYGRLAPDGTVDVTKNDGNILRQTITVPGVASGFVQTYKYDSLNRLSEAQEINGGQQTWKQIFGYDRHGNRTGFSYEIGQTPVALNNINHPSVNPLNNRFQPGQGYEYDLNGNLIQDAEGRKFAFDGDNKQHEIKDASNNALATYSYDGSGRRVKKTVAATQEVTVFIYDAGGQLVAEYSNIVAQNPGTRYITSDLLNTPRVITNSAGEIISRKDYLPFGEDLLAGRSLDQKYGLSSGIRQGFTGYERDDESQLNFAEARYYNHFHGRFTTVDPLMASGKSSNPQTFNRYSYAGNNPTLRVDPNGEDWYIWEHPRVYRDYSSAKIQTHLWSSTWRPELAKVRNHIVSFTEGKIVGLVALDPWENRFTQVGSYGEGVAQIEKYRRQAAINFIVGAAEAMSLALDWTGALKGAGYEKGSEQYKLGSNVGTIISGVSIVTGGGLVNVVAARFGKMGLRVLRELNLGKRVTVLGHFPEYMWLAENVNARRFNIKPKVWAKMSEAEQWAANEKFLDQVIARGDEILLATPLDQIKKDSFLKREVKYLMGKGFEPSADGTRLIRK